MSKFDQGSLAMTEVLCNNVFSLPIHTEMSKETQDYIIQHVLDFFNYSYPRLNYPLRNGYAAIGRQTKTNPLA